MTIGRGYRCDATLKPAYTDKMLFNTLALKLPALFTPTLNGIKVASRIGKEFLPEEKVAMFAEVEAEVLKTQDVGFLTEGVVGSLDGQREVQITPVPERHGQSEFLEGHMLVRYVICDLPQAVVETSLSGSRNIDYGLWKIADDIADQHVTLEKLRLPVPLWDWSDLDLALTIQ
ncbi:hypothetical protein E4U57_001203 [Claviceps arundinis]|uniref:Uncharacterized protein n=1 Tax=Claviceps arundinis TaxID=1623583 RepID=A0ABQ7PD71_9HYPO|nr:hypothetical protein E4U57_001203 [Claviceps arundinis]